MSADDDSIQLPGGVRVDPAELRFTFSRAPGPGGQKVNKTSTRVTLHFDVAGSDALSAAQKQRITEALPGRISKTGVLRVVSSKHRTQAANRRAAIHRFTELLTEALTPRKTRTPTRTPARAHADRIAEKKQRAEKKRLRGRVDVGD
jgi:ribosome-associated protein